MNSAQTFLVAALWVTAFVAVAVAAFGWRRRRMGVWALSFAVLALAVAVWSFAYGLEITAMSLEGKIFWAKIEYLGIVTVPVAWFVFSLQYTQRAGWLSPRWLLILCIIPVITLLLVFTNEAHGLIWSEVGLDSSGTIPVMDTIHGAWFWVHSAYSYVLMIAGAVLLVQQYARYPRAYRRQNGSLVAGALLPLVANVIFLSGILPIPHLDYTTFAFAISALLMANAIFRYHLFDIVPIARRTAVDNMRDGLLVLDLQNRVVDINPAALIFFRRSASEMIGQPLRDFLENQPEVLDNFREITNLDTEVFVTIEGEPRYFSVQFSPLHDRHDNLSARLITFHDVTTRKLFEQELARARDEALEASQFKSELLARVSHELRTPLNAILGFTEMLQEGIYGPLTPTQWEPTQKIIESTGFLTRQVNELLDLARLEAGRINLHNQDAFVRDIVQNVHDQMLVLAEVKKVQLTSQVDENVPTVIHSDPDRISQILLNLVGNAIKFSESGIIHQEASVDNGTLLLRISDQGAGIPPEMQASIFEPFKQVDGSLTRQHSGAGLGLAIVKQITDLMGGSITVESNVGQGSVFTVCLPLTTAVGEEIDDAG